MKKCKLLDKFR